MTPQLLRVMYAPLDYIHPDRFSYTGNGPAGSVPALTMVPAISRTINHELIRRYALPVKLDFVLSHTNFSDRLVSEWHQVRRAAWLLGCKLARGSLARNGGYARLPDLARRFVAIPLDCPALELAQPVTSAGLEMHGAAYLLALRGQLPSALAERLPLLFEPATESKIWSGPLNRSLLTFAFDYAKTTQH
jgi:type III secretion system OrgA/MxiK family protein